MSLPADTATPIRHPHPDVPERGGAAQVAPGVLWLRLPLPGRPDHVNVYALEDDNAWTVIDAGLNSRLGREIWAQIMAGPLRGLPVTRVIVTHHHPDHVGMAGWLRSAHGAEIWASRTTWLFARMLTLDVQQTWPPETLDYYRAAGMDTGIYTARAAARPFNFADVVAPLPLGFHRLDQDDVIRIGARLWRVHLGGGHAPDHVTLWSEDDDLVIAGDQVLPGISPNLGVYATEPGADTVGDWLQSCTRLRALARPGHLVLPGHRLPFTGLGTRLGQLIDNHHTALARLLDHLHQPRSAGACFGPLYGRAIAEGEYILALVEAVGHLNHLHRAGLVTRHTTPGGVWMWQRA